jgi:hypothetical protein
MKYDVHPSLELIEIFRRRPYQGQDPEQSQVLIIGNDANYLAAIWGHDFFGKIIEYHSDGIRFWSKYGRHHPFLLPEYPFDKRTGGVRYHRNFAKMEFSPRDAPLFSFVELLDVPTIGNTGADTNLFFRLLNKKHLQWLEHLIFSSQPKFVLVNQTLVRMIERISRHHNVLTRLSALLEGTKPGGPTLETNGTVIYNGYSFSHSVSNAYLSVLGQTIRRFIAAGPLSRIV